MLRRVTFALVAAASLSAMALTPTAASAGSWRGGSSSYNQHLGNHCYVTYPEAKPTGGLRFVTVNFCD